MSRKNDKKSSPPKITPASVVKKVEEVSGEIVSDVLHKAGEQVENSRPYKYAKRMGPGWVIACVLSVISLLLVLVIILPSVLEGSLNAILAKISAETDIKLSVKRVGMTSADISLGVSDVVKDRKSMTSALDITACSIEYSPLDLLSGRIRKLELSGVNARIDVKDGKFDVPLLHVIKKLSAPKQGQVKTEAKSLAKDKPIPVMIEEISISSGNVIISGDNGVLYVPFELDLLPVRSGDTLSSMKYKMWMVVPDNNTAEMSGDIDIATGQLVSVMNVKADLGSIPGHFRKMISPEATGRFTMTSQIHYNLKTGILEKISSKGEVNKFNFTAPGGVKVCGSPSFSIEGNAESLSAMITGAGIEYADFKLNLAALNANYVFSRSSLSGSFHIDSASVPLAVGTYILEKDAANKWNMSVKGSVEKTEGAPVAAFTAFGNKFSYEKLDISAKAVIGGTVKYEAAISTPELHIKNPRYSGVLSNSAFAVKGENDRLDFDYKCTEASLDMLTFKSCIQGISLCGIFDRNRVDAVFAAGGKDSTIMETKSGFSLKGVTLNMPIAIPSEDKAIYGKLFCEDVAIKKNSLGKFTSNIGLNKGSFTLDGGGSVMSIPYNVNVALQTQTLAGMVAKCSFSAKKPKGTDNVDLGVFSPVLEGFTFNGDFEAGADYETSALGQNGKAFIKLKSVTVENKEKDFLLEDGAFSFVMPSLPDIESAAGQRVSFKSLKYGDIKIDSCRVRFRMDSPESWQIEGVTANWCKGKIRVESTQIDPKAERTIIVVHCDRVNLASLLTQFKVGNGDGGGAISGTIPVVFRKNGEIVFRDGFLYSTPGEENDLHFAAADVLTAGVPKETPAFIQLDLTKEALTDFTYSWAKVSITTKDDKLIFKLHINGKPAKPLKYTFKEDEQQFIRSEVPYNFAGIQLEVNFNLPLSDIMAMGFDLKKIMDKLQ